VPVKLYLLVGPCRAGSTMWGPVERVVLTTLGRVPVDDEVRRLVGAGPDAGADEVRRRFARAEYKVQCAPAPDGKYCLYQYKELRAGRYFEVPVLAAMRGYVTKQYDGGDMHVAAFPFAKFFNLGETGATQNPPTRGFVATEKLDGTLIIVWRDPDTGELHYNTRGMLEWFEPTPAGTARRDYIANPFARAFLSAVSRRRLREDLETLVADDTTVMFELVGRIPASRQTNDPIDPDDPAWTPYLLARRRHGSWRLEYAGVDFDPLNFPAVRSVRVETLGEIVQLVADWRDKEGAVIYYPGRSYEGFNWWNYIVKVKNPVYALQGYIYKPDGTPSERAILRLILAGAYDDLVAYGDENVIAVADEIRTAYEELLSTFEELHSAAQTWTSKQWNVFIHQYKGRWLEPYLREPDPEAALKRLILSQAPRRNVAGQLRRLAHRLSKLHNQIKNNLARNHQRATN